MQSNTARALVALLGVAAIVVGFIVLEGDDDEPNDEQTTAEVVTTEATGETTDTKPREKSDGGGSAPAKESAPTVQVEGGEPRGGVAELSYEKGEPIDFVVESDAADEIHVHGYDIEQPVEAGGRTRFKFPAELEGIFEVELHGTGTLIAELVVNP